MKCGSMRIYYQSNRNYELRIVVQSKHNSNEMQAHSMKRDSIVCKIAYVDFGIISVFDL